MRILLVIASLESGGAETHVASLAHGLAKRGHSVTVASAGGRLCDSLHTHGITHVCLPLDKKDPFSIAKSEGALRKLIREHRFDIVHAHSRIAAFVADRSVREDESHAAFVTTIHAHFRENAVLHSLSRWGRATIAVSEDLGQYLLSHSRDVLAENIRVIPNGIDTQKFSPNNAPRAGAHVVFLSRLDSDCSAAAYALCRIAPALAERFEHLSLTIAGGGEEYENIKGLADRLNASVGREIVRAVGQVDDVPSLLRTADAFVGVSRAALEAMSCAVPTVLAGDEGFIGVADASCLSLAEVTNFCCRGCERISDSALADALSKILAMPQRQREELGRVLRSYTVELHSSELMCERTEEFYSSVLRPRRGKQGVLLCGYYGFGNMGDDVLLVRSIKRAAEKFGRTSVCALTRCGSRDSRRFGVRCEKRSSPMALFCEIKRAKTIVFGGGTLLQNGTSRRSLAYYLAIILYAQKCGKRVELWGNGIGRITGKRSRRMTAVALSRCAYIGVRDRASAMAVGRLLDEHGLPFPHIEIEEDMALGMPAASVGRNEYVLRSLGIEKDRRTAVVAVRGVERHGYARSLERWVRALAKDGYLPIFVAMYPEQDLETCRRLCRDIGGVLAYPIGASDMVALMRRSDIVCAMRYHALVFAYTAGTPFIGFGAEDKIQAFCREHGGVYFTDIE